MKDEDLWHHCHRLYLIGQNSMAYPWVIPKDIPEKALSDENYRLLEKVIKEKEQEI